MINFNHKVPNYVVCASLQTLFNDARYKESIIDEVSRVKLKDCIVSYLTEVVNVKKPESIQKNVNYNKTVYKFVVDRFNQKYASSLSENQRKFLFQYTISQMANNEKVLSKLINSTVSSIKEGLKNIQDKQIKEDKEIVAKINECTKNLESMDFSNVTESKILEILKYIQLVDEIKS